MNDLVKGCNKTRVRFPPAPQNMKKLIKLLKTLIDNRSIEKKKVIVVYSSDNNRIDKDGGPYRVEVTDVWKKTR